MRWLRLYSRGCDDLLSTFSAPRGTRDFARAKSENQAIDGDGAGAEGEDEQRGEEEKKGSGAGEFIGVAKDCMQRFLVRGGVGHQHDNGEGEARGARIQAEHQQYTAETLGGASRGGVYLGEGQVQAGKEVGGFVEVHQFAPAGAHELPAPAEANEDKQRGLQEIRRSGETLIKGFEIHRNKRRSGRHYSRAQSQPSRIHSANHSRIFSACSASAKRLPRIARAQAAAIG